MGNRSIRFIRMGLLAAMVALVAGPGLSTATWAEDAVMPFVLASNAASALDTQVETVKTRVGEAGFRVVADYAPFAGAHVVVVTRDDLLAVAGASPRGGYGAVVRIGLSEVDGKTQVSFINPRYLAEAYRLDGDREAVAGDLETALGKVEAFGAKGMTPRRLRNYNYMFGMQKFDDPDVLGEFATHEEAVSAVAGGLSGGPTSVVFQLEIPGTEQTLFGVAFASDDPDANDAHQMTVVDTETLKRVAYLPYEVLVTGTRVEALNLRFRMAVHFPELGMGTFMRLRAAPGALEQTLRDRIGG